MTLRPLSSHSSNSPGISLFFCFLLGVSPLANYSMIALNEELVELFT